MVTAPLAGWEVESGVGGGEDGKRRAERDDSYGFLEKTDHNSHEAPLHIQDNDTGGTVPTSSWSSLKRRTQEFLTLLVLLNPGSRLEGVF